MNYEYSYNYADPFGEAFVAAFAAVYGIILLLCAALGIAAYVMRSCSLHTIAKRRGINHPWLAWLPIGCQWILGSISDQYQYVVKDQIKSRRKVLLGLSVLNLMLLVGTLVLAVFVLGNILSADNSAGAGMIAYRLGAYLITLLVACVVLLVLSIVALVFRYMSMYDLFRSCDPHNAVAYLVLGIVGSLAQSVIVFIALLEPIFLLVCRKKDGGMPPRRDAMPMQPQFFQEPPKPVEPWEE